MVSEHGPSTFVDPGRCGGGGGGDVGTGGEGGDLSTEHPVSEVARINSVGEELQSIEFS